MNRTTGCALTTFTTALLLVPLTALHAVEPQKPAAKPNILVILSDDQGYADAGFQGCKDIPTPQLDRLARSGLRCTSGYVSHPYCSPSRAGLLTGRCQMRFGHERNPHFDPDDRRQGLPLSETLLPQYLRAAGYVTGWIGKWHLGAAAAMRPENRGFQETFGFLGGGHYYLNWKVNPGAEYNIPIERNGHPVEVKEHLTLAFGHEAAAFVGRHKSQPWFLYLAFNAPHTPHQPTPERLTRFANIKNPTRRRYAAQVSLLDDAIGEALAALRETGQEKNTLVFFLSDNGGAVWHLPNTADNAPLRGFKGQTYEGGVRVPFVVSWPGHLPSGKDYPGMVSSLDIFPTALALAGVPLPADKPLDGVNLVPFLNEDNRHSPHARLFWRETERQQGSAKEGGYVGGFWGVRDGDMKLVWQRRRPEELYDLRLDLGERKDLAANRPLDLKKLDDELATWDKLGAPLAFQGDGGLDDGYHPGQEAAIPANDNSTTTIPKPTPAQLAWQEAELGVLLHYDPRIFNGKYDAQSLQNKVIPDPQTFAQNFNPPQLDTDQWVATAKATGATFAILVVKHETGFCLWQSDANPYCLKMLKWRDGKADILRDFIASCKKYSLKPGVFTEARWDAKLAVSNYRVTSRSPLTQAQYNHMVEGEVKELCTRYGDLFEIWFDGGALVPAQGGPDLLPIAEAHQPGMIFYHTEQRRDVRWGGTETGTVGYPCWSTVDKISGWSQAMMRHGDSAGKVWCPAMADVPLRSHGLHHWLWAPGGDKGVATLQELQKMYYESVGRNATLVIGLTPDRAGLMPQTDVKRCREFGAWLHRTLAGKPLAETSGKGTALTLEVPVDAQSPVTHVVLQEDIRNGERVREYVVEAEVNGAWKELCAGNCIGHKRIEGIPPCAARKFRLRVTKSVGEPAIRAFCLR